jgi:hypothetical protein
MERVNQEQAMCTFQQEDSRRHDDIVGTGKSSHADVESTIHGLASSFRAQVLGSDIIHDTANQSQVLRVQKCNIPS